MKNSVIPTLSINEAVLRMRAYGIPTSHKKLGAGIEQGKYPFGISIKSESGRRLFEIYEADFERWVKNRVTGNYEANQ